MQSPRYGAGVDCHQCVEDGIRDGFAADRGLGLRPLCGDVVLEIQGCDTPDGSFEKVLEVTVSAAGEAYRERVPVACPRFVRLVATTLASGSAELSYRV